MKALSNRSLVLALLASSVLAACASRQLLKAKPERAPASITGQRPLPAVAYFRTSGIQDFLRQWKQEVNNSSDPEAYYPPGLAPHADTLEKIFSDIVMGARAISRSEAPSPQLVIYKSSTPNAFVLTVPTCLVDAAYFEGEKDNPDLEDAYLVRIGNTTDFQLLTSPIKADKTPPKVACMKMRSSATLEEFSGHRIFLNGFQCQTELKQGRLVFRCPNHPLITPVRYLVYRPIAPFIFVSASLIGSLHTREEFEAIVAHELGHYFLGHGSSFGDERPSYFFRREPDVPAFRPPVDPSLGTLSLVVTTIGNLNTSEPQRYFHHSLAGEIFLSAMLALAKDHDRFARQGYKFDRNVCGRELLNEEYYEDLVNTVKLINPNAKERAKIEAAFEKLKPCAKSFSVATGKPSTFLDFYGKRIESPNEEVENYIFDGRMPEPSINAWDAYKKLDVAVAGFMASPSSRVDLKTLGYYTAEEEADVFSMNYLKAAQLDVHALPNALANYGRELLAHPPVKDQNLAECVAAHDHNWMKDGQPYRPQVADYSDPHHDLCFRMLYLEEIVPRLGEADPYDQIAGRHIDAFFPPIARDYRKMVPHMPELKPGSALIFF